MSDKELMDAVSAAIDGAGGPAPAAEETTDENGTDAANAAATDQPGADGEAAAGDDGQGGDPAAAKGDAELGDGDEANAGGKAPGAESGAPERDPKTGKFVARGDGKGAAPDPAAAAAKGAQPDPAKPGAKPAAGKPAAPKPPDHVNDPIPEEVKGKTRERMQGLITQAKALTTERDTIKGEHDEMLAAINATGADVDTFWKHTQVLGLMMSAEPADQRRAVTFLRGAADKIAAALGDVLPGHDPLKDPANKDLADEVESGDLSRARALELAQARAHTAAASRRTNETDQQRQAREARETAVNDARTELNALGDELKKANPAAYARKAAVLLPAVQEMVKHTPPAQWATAYRAMYDKLEVSAAPAPKPGNRVPRGTGTNQPARPTQGAGGGGPREPQSGVEALDLGIAAAAQVHR